MASRSNTRSRSIPRTAESGFEHVFEAALDVMLLIAPSSGELVRANGAIERCLGYPPSQVTGRSFSALFARPPWPGAEGLLADVRARGPRLGEQTLRRADGSACPMELTALLIPWGDGEMLVVGLRDVSERKRADEALREKEEHLELVLRGADLGLWDWDIEAGTIQRSPRAAAIVGYTPDELGPDARAWDDIVHSDDRERVLGQMRAHLRGETPHFESEHRLRHRSGDWVWVLNWGTVVRRSADGRPLRATGTQMDISDRKRSEAEREALLEIAKGEAQYSAALARAAQDLMSSVTTPEVYERLCEVAAALLECDVAATFLWSAREQAYVAAAIHGGSPERWEELRVLKLGPQMVDGLLAAFAPTGLVRIDELDVRDPVRRSLGSVHERGSAMLIALRRSDELVGFLSAGYRAGEAGFSVQHERIALGVAQIASLALENARLVEELERANRVKSDFVATMSHELRTPLSVVIGYHDLLLEGEFGALTAEQAERLRRADDSARELLGLINATLDLSRLEARRVPVQLFEVDIGAMIEALAAELSPVRERSRSTFAWRLPHALPRLHSDPLKLKVVLKHLLHNAFKFTEAGAVTVSIHGLSDRVQFEVADTGVGIAPDLLGAIFEPFRQGDGSSTRTYGGAGLGLFIVQRLLELLGGEIEVESELGRGSRFRFWIPLTDPAA